MCCHALYIALFQIVLGATILTGDQASLGKSKIREKYYSLFQAKVDRFSELSELTFQVQMDIRHQWFFLVYGLKGLLKAQESYGSSQESEHMDTQTILNVI